MDTVMDLVRPFLSDWADHGRLAMAYQLHPTTDPRGLSYRVHTPHRAAHVLRHPTALTVLHTVHLDHDTAAAILAAWDAVGGESATECLSARCCPPALVRMIAGGRLPRLRTLDLGGDGWIGDVLLHALADRCPRLTALALPPGDGGSPPPALLSRLLSFPTFYYHRAVDRVPARLPRELWVDTTRWSAGQGEALAAALATQPICRLRVTITACAFFSRLLRTAARNPRLTHLEVRLHRVPPASRADEVLRDLVLHSGSHHLSIRTDPHSAWVIDRAPLRDCRIYAEAPDTVLGR